MHAPTAAAGLDVQQGSGGTGAVVDSICGLCFVEAWTVLCGGRGPPALLQNCVHIFLCVCVLSNSGGDPAPRLVKTDTPIIFTSSFTVHKLSLQQPLQKFQCAAKPSSYNLADRQDICKCTPMRGQRPWQGRSGWSMVCVPLCAAHLPAEVILHAQSTYSHADWGSQLS